jgi:SAM-dependent methyltransferase
MTATCWVCGAAAGPCDDLSPLPFARCTSCGFVFRPDLITATRDLYEGGAYAARDFTAGYAIDDTLAERVHNARTRLAWLREYATAGRLLDVGAAGGAFVLEAGRMGFDAWGIEPVPAFARYARDALGVDVREGRIEDVELEPRSLDLVTLWHVLEHVPEPRGTLERLREALRPGGLLILEVPNVSSVMARSLGTAWVHLDPAAHANHFAPATLRALLVRAGFEVRGTETIAHSAYLTPRKRIAPRHVAYRVKLARHGVWRIRHPDRHELLRAVGARSADSGPR